MVFGSREDSVSILVSAHYFICGIGFAALFDVLFSVCFSASVGGRVRFVCRFRFSCRIRRIVGILVLLSDLVCGLEIHVVWFIKSFAWFSVCI